MEIEASSSNSHNSSLAYFDEDLKIVSEQLLNLAFTRNTESAGLDDHPVKAKTLFECAANLGNADGMYHYALILEKGDKDTPPDYDKVRELLEKSSKLGHVLSIVDLGCKYMQGVDGFVKNGKKALELLQSADGHHALDFHLGVLYQDGCVDIPQDLAKAKHHFEIAASKGSPYAMLELGEMYEQGNAAVKRDTKKAIDFYKKASSYGLKQARTALRTHTLPPLYPQKRPEH